MKSRSAGRSLFFTFFILFNGSLFAQTLDPYKFFPSSVGNIWEYSGILAYRAEIYRDSLDQNGFNHLFFSYDNNYPSYATFKIDTSNFIAYYTPYNLNWLFYKLDADSGDHWMVRAETTEIQRMEALVRDKYPAIFFGRETTIMKITYYDLNWGDTVINQNSWPRFTMTLAYGIGEIMEFDEEGGGPQRILQGCIIDGDTIGVITSAEGEQNTVNSFELFQNYPNPFNPNTTIKFSISEPQKVKLTIYSLLGEEIKVLVDEYKSTGSYSVAFDGGDLSSGVYIYSLIAGNKRSSKKLILLK
jgi:hypothetical protein